MDEDELPRLRKQPLKDLAPLGIAELEAYIAELETEIARTRDAIEARRKHRSGIEGLFKK